MQEKSLATGYFGATQARPYTQHEYDMIAQCATLSPCRWADVSHLFPGRTRSAISKKVAVERKRNNDSRSPGGNKPTTVGSLAPDDPGMDDDWFENWKQHCAIANTRFVCALLEAR